MIQNYNTPCKFKTFNFFNKQTFLWSYGFAFFKNFEKLLNKKNILITNSNINIISNKIYFNLDLFYLTSKISKFRKKMSLKLDDNSNKNNFLNFIITQFKTFKTNIIIFKLNIINAKIKKKSIFLIFKKLKRFTNIIFVRRFNLFIDFLKILSLLLDFKISAKIFLIFLQRTFKNLTKKQHNQFLSFLKICFNLLIYDLKSFTKHPLKGIKLIINGKLKGKPRANSTCILVGNVSNQTLSSNIDYSKIHVYTLYGVFGLKIWISR